MEANFKHVVVVNGSLPARKRFVEELGKIGYKIPDRRLCLEGYSSPRYCITVNYKNSIGNYTTPYSGVLEGFSNEGAYWRKRGVQYQFEIDNENEFQAALAIAAIRDDENTYIGEVWNCERTRPYLMESKRTNGTGWNLINLSTKESVSYTSPENLFGYGGMWTKATPEEIIQYFKTNNMTRTEGKTTNGKKIVGYKLKKSEYREAALQITSGSGYLRGGSSYSKNTPYIPVETIAHEKLSTAGVLDLWFEPVYEAEEVTIGGHTAKKEGSGTSAVIAFGCQKFNSPELYAYRKLIESSETKAELTIHGTKITVEILDKLIGML